MRAAITVLSHWRMGDGDPGVGQSVDIVGGNTMSLTGPTYAQSASSAALAHCGSVYSVHFLSATYGTANPFNNSDNFGLEFWVNPAGTSGTQALVYSGNSLFEGWGIYLINGAYVGRIAQNNVGSGTATAGQWTHLALVRTNGTAVLFVNGVVSGSSSTASPLVPVGNPLRVAGNSFSPTTESAPGYIDEVRVFTFATGQFSTNDLLLNAPYPSPAATTLAATALADTSATLNGSVNPSNYPTTVWFEYGPTAAYGQTSASTNVGAGASAAAASFNVTGLLSGLTYHYRVTASNAFAVVHGSDVVFRKPQTNYVTAFGDNGPGTLRDLISNSVPGDTILLTNTGFIDITNNEIFIGNSLSIVSVSGSNVVRQRFSTDRIFEIGAGANVLMSGLQLTTGKATNSPISIYAAGNGGAIFNSGTLTLYQCAIENCKAGDGAGTSFGPGGPGGSGGGIFNAPGSGFTASNCCFAWNSAGNGGAGANTSGGAAGSAEPLPITRISWC